MSSIECVKEILRNDAVVFFELPVGDDEDGAELAKELSKLGCTAVVDPIRRVIRVRGLPEAPDSLGYL